MLQHCVPVPVVRCGCCQGVWPVTVETTAIADWCFFPYDIDSKLVLMKKRKTLVKRFILNCVARVIKIRNSPKQPGTGERIRTCKTGS